MMDAMQLQAYRQILEQNGDCLTRLDHTGLRKKSHELVDFGDHTLDGELVDKAKGFVEMMRKKLNS